MARDTKQSESMSERQHPQEMISFNKYIVNYSGNAQTKYVFCGNNEEHVRLD